MINNVFIRLKNIIKNFLNTFQIKILTKMYLNLIVHESRYSQKQSRMKIFDTIKNL